MKNFIHYFSCFVLCINSSLISAQKVDFLNKKIQVYTTSKASDLRLTETETLSFQPATQPLETEISIFINPNKAHQTLLGIGGAITDASAVIFDGLSAAKKQELLNAYYDVEKGIGYSLLRTTIHSSDFSPESYTYVEEGDADLKTFSIAHDKEYRIPMIKKATETAGGAITLYVSPWSPPAFMKTNGSMLKGGKLKPEFRQNWANYYAKFIKAYEAEGMPIWGLTIQNEPMATQTWESCIYTAEEERDFLKDYLGPTLEREGLGAKNIVVWDHNRDLMVNRSNVIFEDPEASKYAWGTGFHWYETWTGAEPLYENVNRVNEAFPDKKLMFTEGCIEKFDASRYQYWPNGERYGEQMIHDFNNGTVAWTDWNILLNQNGGPNHVGNFCFAPIHADTTTGELIYTPSYYYIGHFSKFIKPGAKRLSSAVSRSVLLSTTFKNDDNSLVTVVMNKTDKDVTYSLYIEGAESSLNIPAHSIQSLIY
ncbi:MULTISPECIES: glycoside hydrolase family 30 beta sandwich domain-containing protein [unclassified Leeuwenhoekiella]|uniref:glycoside hydrolase family 30 protein n=1 Tax=unclassified Leeuwenhoekiella TaxID=2615029 RepID=UPI000C56ED6C|nr:MULTISPECIES: glycoside hydrolase family 30 beta sandwich domain-containing protein [unclassified Leeuwenhoekiella]MAW94364.1 glycosyl hydrolase [Leeuwenhoekiella sp.]MBA81040.1 glycosyl hydrolase [Leeuwenhoekiella sp.]|tara:strand:- start:46317 stop:47762 length:1446 start_codon:yes stop_codon:yes gene_type:complete